MSDRDEMDAETVRLVFYRLLAITSAVICSPLSPKNWWSWTFFMLMGYFQTEHDLYHPSGEDASTWREEAEGAGITVPTFESDRARKQRELYAEAMAPRVAERMLGAMRGEAVPAPPTDDDCDDGKKAAFEDPCAACTGQNAAGDDDCDDGEAG